LGALAGIREESKRDSGWGIAVYIGEGIAYKYDDRPRGAISARGRNHVAAKKKPTKRLKKSKKVVPTKPLFKII
jgi:hypothetical protein